MDEMIVFTNRTVTKTLEESTPYKKRYGKKPYL